MTVDIHQLPIPDWGLQCPGCGYPLRGLPRHRCPECGREFEIAELISPWTRLRDPRFTGAELPLPDFGLPCPACGRPLAGATAPACPACAAPFDPQDWRPTRPWFVVDRELCATLPVPGVQALLAAEQVPYMPLTERSAGEIYTGQSLVITRLRVPSEFFFEVLWLIRRALAEQAAARRQAAWRCRACGRRNPGNFEVCWNCQAERR